jgi:hypothetical protein
LTTGLKADVEDFFEKKIFRNKGNTEDTHTEDLNFEPGGVEIVTSLDHARISDFGALDKEEKERQLAPKN